MWTKRNPLSVRISTALALFNKTENEIDLFIDAMMRFRVKARILAILYTCNLRDSYYTATAPSYMLFFSQREMTWIGYSYIYIKECIQYVRLEAPNTKLHYTARRQLVILIFRLWMRKMDWDMRYLICSFEKHITRCCRSKCVCHGITARVSDY